MDFFEHQRQARKQTSLLVFLFALSVICIVTVIDLSVLAAYRYYLGHWAREGTVGFPEWQVVITTSIVVLAGMILGSVYRMLKLRQGQGSAVAELVGARRVSLSNPSEEEKRLINIVEEMSIASGCNRPSLWVLDNEPSINAFAAGYSISEATIVVSKGCLTLLSRDELQGVIAHEFSHIFNGDMRTNIRMLALLNGILVLGIAGFQILNLFRKTGGRGADARALPFIMFLLVVAGVLFAMGYIGVFFGRLIKATLGRTREYLADASAVQFTRNPTGIAGALKKIHEGSGSRLLSPKSEQLSHFYFSDGIGFSSSLYATHPPLSERLNRVFPDWKKKLDISYPRTIAATPISDEKVIQEVGAMGFAEPERAHEIQGSIPESLKELSRTTEGAATALFALISVEHTSLSEEFSQYLQGTPVKIDGVKAAHQTLKLAGEKTWFPLLQLLMPSLQELYQEHRDKVIEACQKIADSDSTISTFEASILAVVERSLAAASQKIRTNRFPTSRERIDMIVLLAIMARADKKDGPEVIAAFAKGIKKMRIPPVRSIPNTSPSMLPRVLNSLVSCNINLKEQLLLALREVVLADKRRSSKEIEILRAVSNALECPLPPV